MTANNSKLVSCQFKSTATEQEAQTLVKCLSSNYISEDPVPISEDKLDSHAVYLALGQHSVLHKIRQHLHHGLLNGCYNQMHPVDWNETQASLMGATSSSSASRNSKGAKCRRRRMTVSGPGLPFLSDRLTDRLLSSVLLSEEVPSVLTPLPLIPPPPSAECLCVFECESDSCLEGRAAVSTRCLRHTQLCIQSVLSVSLFYSLL